MDQPAPMTADGALTPLARWAASLPPPPFIDSTSGPADRRFAPLSPRVAVLIAAAIVIGLLLWMARDSVRPFIIGLLFVSLLDPPVRWMAVGVFTFIGLTLVNQLVDPIFGRYAVLLSIIAGVLELVPIIGPIISAIPAVLLAATAGIGAVIAALVLYTLVQQIENSFLLPKIQGDAVQLYPSVVVFAIIIGGALAGLLGAILALPVTAAFRDVVRYLFRRLSSDEPEALAASLRAIGMGPTDG